MQQMDASRQPNKRYHLPLTDVSIYRPSTRLFHLFTDSLNDDHYTFNI